MSSHFIANQLYTETEIKDYIMNCDSKHHKAVYEAIVSYGQETEQYIMPFQDWIKEFDDKVRVIGAGSPGDYVRNSINNDYYGEDYD